jgi:hypothetical protein
LSQPEPVAKHDAAKIDSTTPEVKRNIDPHNTLDRTMVCWTRVVGIFTAVLAAVAPFQYWAFVQSERAFLSVTSLAIDGDFPKPGDKLVRVFFQVKNSGKSAAYANYVTLSMALGHLPDAPYYGNEQQRAHPPIAPEAIAPDRDDVILSRPLTQADIDAVKAGTARLSFFGFMTYTDVFQFWPIFPRKTYGFCFTYSATPTGASPFVTCPELAYTYQK